VRRVVLTGASAGLGRALALRLAAPGAALLLTGRDAGRLEAVAAAARELGAAVETAALDVTDREGMAAALTTFDAAGPVDLVIANAGVSAGLAPGHAPERPEDARRVWETNYVGMLNTVEPLLPALIARRRGRIALMGSLAALRPLPDMPSYSASKAAVRAYGAALRGWLGPMGVGVTVISPGFVTTAMSARHRGFKPFALSADRAADLIARRLEADAPLITFPWPLALMVWLNGRMPPVLGDWAARGFRADIDPEKPA
jgi:NADP-dependent 3-hydroxy acid dehydrogenase YdfG